MIYLWNELKRNNNGVYFVLHRLQCYLKHMDKNFVIGILNMNNKVYIWNKYQLENYLMK